MATLDVEGLLQLVKEMDHKLDQYLAGSAPVTDLVRDILTNCKRIHEAGLDDAACYWLAAVQHHASGLGQAQEDVAGDEHLFSSSEFLRVHLLRDLSFLRLHIRNSAAVAR